ncbi:MAG: hypothetical protein K9N35_03755 [Candidatus Marinimicrobia bacterium]|nr:hypothetical protein [Candidatus Neomarinimicrobiota bacterium]
MLAPEIIMLMDLGFSELESHVYIKLLQGEGHTGYRISQLLNKPVSNIYKALDSLHKKGVILLDNSGKNKLYSALPIETYLDQMEYTFKRKRESIEDAFEKITTSPQAEGVYNLEDFDQVFITAGAIINESREILLIDAFPGPLERVKESLIRKAKEGVDVFVKIYAPVDLPGCKIIEPDIDLYGEMDLSKEWFNIVADNAEYLNSFLDTEHHTVYQAVWTKSRFLNMVMYSGMAHDFILNNLSRMIRQKKPLSEISEQLKKYQTEIMDNQYVHLSLSELFSK